MTDAPPPQRTVKAPANRKAPRLRSGVAARLLPQTRFGGPIPWVIAILIALVVVAAAGGLSLRNLAQNARADLSGAVTVQIVEANAVDRNAQAQAVADTLTGNSMVKSVRVVPEAELTELLEPWLGASASSDDVPMPALIDVELTGRASAAQIGELQSVIAQAAPDARIDAQSDWLEPVYDALSALQYLALGLIALVAFATAAAVWMAARSALANHGETVEIIHLLGGTDAQITSVFQRSVIRDATFGGLVGLALGTIAVWLLGQQFAVLDNGMVSGGGLEWSDWLIIAAIPVAGVLLALVTGRITIGFALRSML